MDEVPPVCGKVDKERAIFGEIKGVRRHLEDWKDGDQACVGGKEEGLGAVDHLIIKAEFISKCRPKPTKTFKILEYDVGRRIEMCWRITETLGF